MKGFGSDNHSGVHLELMQALTAANVEHAPSYGTDSWSSEAKDEFAKLFGKKVEVFFVYNGTAANVSALKALSRTWNSVLCSDVSHLNVDECGAPELLAGIKLCPLSSHQGKISVESLEQSFIRRGDQHYSQSKIVSLTQPTELGTCYSLDEIRLICSWAHKNGLLVHIDGARLSNAVVGLNTSFKEMLTDTGVDVISFGGTKNGFMFGEAVVFLNTDFAKDFAFLRKQLGQLPSKTRFIAAQFTHYLKTGLWKKIATDVNAKAHLLFESVHKIPGVTVTMPVQSNAVFACVPKKWVPILREKYFFYVWNEETFECRWMVSFDTSDDDIKGFAEELRKLSKSL